MATRRINLDDQTQQILSYMAFSEGPDGSVIGKIVTQLDRKTYEKVNKALTALGGKWNRKAGGHIFPTDPRPHVEEALEEGALTVEKDGFFETPPAVVDKMRDLAGDLDGLHVLEPSAGIGAIATRLTGAESIFCIEKNSDRAALLRQKGFEVLHDDFLASGPFTPGFDRIIMNPPFEAGQDIDHVRHAFSMLAPGGVLVSIMCEGPFFRDDRKSVEFREWLDDAGGYAEPLPDKSFHASGTDVKTRIVIIRAPWAKPINEGGNTMKTIVDAQNLGTFSLEDGSKLTYRQALKENELSPKEWKLVDTKETKTTIKYTIAPKVAAVEPTAAVESVESVPTVEESLTAVEPAPVDSNQAPVTDASDRAGYRFTYALTGTDLSAPADPPAEASSADTPPEEAPTRPTHARITVPRDELLPVLQVCCELAGGKGSFMPVLATVRIDTDDENLTVTATDLELSYTATVPTRFSEPASFLVNADLFFKEVRALGGDVEDVKLVFDKDCLDVNRRCTLNVSEPDDFPVIPSVDGPAFTIPKLKDAIARVLPAVSVDETRYILTGVYFDLSAGCLVGTDGFRLHKASTTRANLPAFVLPRRAAAILQKYGAESVSLTDNRFCAVVVGGIFTSRVIEGAFPDCRNVWPKAEDYDTVTFSAKEFLDLVPGMLPLSNNSSVRITINGRIDIETDNDNGSYKWFVPAVSTLPEGESVHMQLNCRFLMDAIKAYAQEKTVTIRFHRLAYGSIVINDKALVMPIRG